MTEETWLSATDIDEMWRVFPVQEKHRKLCLWACACCRRIWERIPTPNRRSAELAEAFADGQATFEELQAATPAFRDAQRTNLGSELPASYAPEWTVHPRPFELDLTSQAVADAVFEDARRSGTRDEADDAWFYERAGHADLLRDVFGNPFRPASFAPEWRTDTAVALARRMYESREFSAMPILADALQDVGCDSEDILSHCRDTSQPHVRGCWVVDLVLGRSKRRRPCTRRRVGHRAAENDARVASCR